MITRKDIIRYAYGARPIDSYLRKLSNSSERYYHFLHHLSRNLNGLFVVLGVNEAVCCAHICSANDDVYVVGVDHNRTDLADDVANKFGNFTYVIDISLGSIALQVIDKFVNDVGKISAVLFDTIHTYDQVIGEYNHLKKYLLNGAVLIFDDVHAAEDDVLRAVNEIPGEYIPLDYLHRSLGFGVKLYDTSVTI